MVDLARNAPQPKPGMLLEDQCCRCKGSGRIIFSVVGRADSERELICCRCGGHGVKQ